MPPETNLKADFFARTMRTSDVELVAQNEAAAYDHPWTKRIIVDCLRAGYQCWVLANKQKIVAHAVVSVAIGECHLLTLCVHPDHQRNGYGRKLFNLLLVELKSKRLRSVFSRFAVPIWGRSRFIAQWVSCRSENAKTIIPAKVIGKTR